MSIIKVEDLSKSYYITHEGQERYTALRDVVAKGAKKIFSFKSPNQRRNKSTREEFWALKDVSFEISQGDRVGIIGRNGAGKSTLLKILSRITEPTKGRITIKGRVASLLEVGTGFHPELTGRENIYLNGAILGMSRAEIKSKFDEIVAFAEIEKFLDTPVKRYSSGMYVRLAFAVAAHLEPEILVVDEVLAVGDAQFQKKCLGKMEDVSKNEGRTVLFVSHNMNIIKALCNNGILLQHGQLIETGNAASLVNKYLFSDDIKPQKYSHKVGGKDFEIYEMTIEGQKDPILRLMSLIKFEISFMSHNYKGEVEFFVLIYNAEGLCVQGIFQTDTHGYSLIDTDTGRIVLSLYNNLIPGKYFVSVGAFDNFRNFLDWVEYCESFEVEPIFPNERIYQDRLGLSLGNPALWLQEK